MYTLIVWDTDESMPETVELKASTIKEAKKEADTHYPNAYSLVITKTGSNKSIANRWTGEEWLGK